ncbi:MAG: hypothetical protein KBA82_08895 [Nitrosomonas sp.]|nr:hypothetical protein [Nitrosomonas sp.]MBP7113073.1 hypothetical protein [Nitrosomonas sp.]
MAGAAEEIIEQAFKDQSVFELVKKKLSADLNLPEIVFSQEYMNKARI